MYRWLDHTAELALEIEAAGEEEAFRDALAAFAELVAPENVGGEPARHDVSVEAPRGGDLLAAWLEELLYLADVDAFVPERVDELELRPDGLDAVVSGRRDDPRPILKAVTYHGLRLDEEGGRWYGHVVLDV